MKKLLLILSSIILTLSAYGQVSVSITDMTNVNTGAPISGSITINSNSSVRIAFIVKMTKSSSQVAEGNLNVYTKKTSGSAPQARSASIGIFSNMWVGSTSYSSNQDITLSASDFNASGGTLYAEFETSTSVKYASADRAITVSAPATPAITNNSISGDQTIVTGNAPSTITGSTPSGGNGSYTYSWQQNSSNGSWTTVSGATGKDYSPGNLNVTTSYRRVVTSSSLTSTSNTVVITVLNAPIANNVITGTQAIEEGSPLSSFEGSIPTGGNGSYAYQWQVKGTGDWNNISIATFKDYASDNLQQGTYYFRRIVSSENASSSISNEITVTIFSYPPIANNSIAFDGIATVIGSVPEGGNNVFLYEYTISTDYNDGLEFSTGFTSNKDYVVSSYFLTLIQSSYTVWVVRTVKSGNKISLSLPSVIILGSSDISNNNISFDGISLITGSTPSGGTGNYTYSWEFIESATLVPTVLSAQTNKDLSVPYFYMYSTDLNTYMRRVVNSGTKVSYSEWVSVLALNSGSRMLSSLTSEEDLNYEGQNSGKALYPNPTKGKINFNIVGSGEAKISVYNLSNGFDIEVFKGDVKEERNLEWNIPIDFPKGTYYYKITIQGKSRSGRFVYE